MLPTAEEVAWAAGFFEGEGCITIARGKPYSYPMASLNGCDLEPVERFGRIVGVGKVRGPYSKNRPGWRPTWIWTASSREDFAVVMEMLLPHLSERRRNRYYEVIAEVGATAFNGTRSDANKKAWETRKAATKSTKHKSGG